MIVTDTCSHPRENLEAEGGLVELASVRKFPGGGGGVMCCLSYEEDIGEGLVSKLLFDEIDGTTVDADVGPAGTVTGGRILETGGLELAAGGFVTLGNPPALNPTAAMTVCLWVTLTEDLVGGWHLLATKWDDTGRVFAWHFGVQDTVLNLYLSEDGSGPAQPVCVAESLMAEHGLVHTCFTAEAGGAVQIYMDGYFAHRCRGCAAAASSFLHTPWLPPHHGPGWRPISHCFCPPQASGRGARPLRSKRLPGCRG